MACREGDQVVQRTILLITCLMVSTTLGQHRRNYDITIRRLNTAEQQLLHDYNRAIGLRKYQIQDQLEAVRRQKLEIERLRAGVVNKPSYSYRKPSSRSRSTYRPYRYSPPKPDWKDVEKPHVVVKGTAQFGDRYGALVSGGRMVFSNDVFSTTYKNEVMHWRVLEVTVHDARFERVNPDGTPYVASPPELPEPEPELVEPVPPKNAKETKFLRIFNLEALF
jgi:hypothetical protein